MPSYQGPHLVLTLKQVTVYLDPIPYGDPALNDSRADEKHPQPCAVFGDRDFIHIL